MPWFKEGAYNSNVRKLMSRGLARFGKGGNGELVEAFQSGERLVIKQVLLSFINCRKPCVWIFMFVYLCTGGTDCVHSAMNYSM